MIYRVEYLKHSLLDDVKRFTVEMSQGELIELLKQGMVTVLSATYITK